MKIALVGFNDTEFDFTVLADVYKLLSLKRKNIESDSIDLSKGRDFLKEDKKYDVVVLNYIFVATQEELEGDIFYQFLKLYPKHPMITQAKTSDLHSKENWRKRLSNSGAKDILVFGYDSKSEVTGDWIGKLSGYIMKTIIEKHGSIWRYTRDEIHRHITL